MSEKSLGQIAHEKWMSRHPGACKPWSDLNVFTQGDYEVMAQAVAQKVREETIEECCRAICAGCKRGEPVALGAGARPNIHPRVDAIREFLSRDEAGNAD